MHSTNNLLQDMPPKRLTKMARACGQARSRDGGRAAAWVMSGTPFTTGMAEVLLFLDLALSGLEDGNGESNWVTTNSKEELEWKKYNLRYDCRQVRRY